MKILFCDDQPNQFLLYRVPLEAAGHRILASLDLKGALHMINESKNGDAPVDLVVVDLMFDRYEASFKEEQAIILKSNPRFHSQSGQALGLRLWCQTPRTPYCYLSTEPRAWWVPNLLEEFSGSTPAERSALFIQKSHAKAAGMEKKLQDALDLWKAKGW